MSHWLEEAEKIHIPDSENVSRADRLMQKYLRIQENVKNNGQLYGAFTNDLHGLIDRVNKLPASRRASFNKMEGRVKQSKLSNHLNIFSSSRRIKMKRFRGFIPFLNTYNFKQVRVVYIYISSKEGIAEIELKENFMQRLAVIPDHKEKRNKKEQTPGSGKFHVTFPFPINQLDHEMALEIIDWLAFSKEISECSFYNAMNKEVIHFL